MSDPFLYEYCPFCSNKLVTKTIEGIIRQNCLSCPRPIYRYTPQTAASIVVNKAGEILMTERKNEPLKGLWSLPAGFVQFGENPIDAALRELKEETGLDAKLDKIVGIYLADENPETYSILTVISTKEVGGNLKAGDDASKAIYFSKAKLPKFAFSAQLMAVKAFMGTGV